MKEQLTGVAGILLAGGKAHRYGSPKALLDWNGEPFVRHISRTILDAGLDPLVVVSGAYPIEIETALDGLQLEIVNNPDWEKGQAGSLQTGLRRLARRCEAVIFFLVDQPQVSVEVIRSLVKQYWLTQAEIISPSIGGKRANPVLFSRELFPALLMLAGDTGGRALFRRFPVLEMDWPDVTLLLDVDTPEDYEILKEAVGFTSQKTPGP